MRYLGLMLDHRDDFRQAAKQLRARKATSAVRKVAAQDHGCSQQTALQLYNASAVGLPLFTLRKLNWQQLEGDHWTCFGMRSATSHGVDARDGGGRAAGPGSHRLAVACSRGRPLCSDCTSPGTRSLPPPQLRAGATTNVPHRKK